MYNNVYAFYIYVHFAVMYCVHFSYIEQLTSIRLHVSHLSSDRSI